MKILWQSKSLIVCNSILKGRIEADANGGNAYDAQAALSLSKHYDLQPDLNAVRKNGESMAAYWWKMKRKADADLLIMEPYAIVFGRRTSLQKSIGVIHHIDEDIRSRNIFRKKYFKSLIENCKKLDAVVTVSEFWKNYLNEKGVSNVEVIYNSFDLSLYQNKHFRNDNFKKRFSIPLDKPVIYIGAATRNKGVYEVYDALKDSGYHLVMSGPVNKAADLNVQYLKLEKEDYLQLLACSSATVVFSLMTEGWNRVAHESLLLGTPVVGSGSGGMEELLTNAGQLIVRDKSLIAESVKRIIASREQFAEKGYRYSKKFDLAYFESSWVNLVKKITVK